MRRLARLALTLATLALGAIHGAAQSELVITKKGSKQYHWPSCPVVKDGKDVLALTRAQANSRGLEPHSACDPANAPAGPRDDRGRPTIVYIDGSRYYHKKECKKLRKDAKEAKLEEAGRKYWPCPTCKPPIRKRPGRTPDSDER